ncbi:dienelactone hydrolase family protein [Dietzia aerolata]|uniref:Dienelactone hydrolase family protein n=1 Tax=Dietzia aerolata TaxID=595984 RepID=A0ABV5JSZ0_9ACTN|nr:dienelactone hydrolase family protein [Dietzia aerolata]MBB0967812.1 dienelactone hydrolase family protein [Dietzia aerolata]
MGTTLEIATDDGTAEAYLTGSGPGVLLFIDAIGLRPRIEEMADRIAGWGYTVLAPNVFYRLGTRDELLPPIDLTVPENRKAYGPVIMPRVQGYTPDQSNPDTSRWLDTLGEHATPGPVGVTGYCMGARLAIGAAALRPEHVAAAAGFHGAALVDGSESSPHLLLPHCRAEFAFGHADADPANDAEAIAELGRSLDAAGLTALNETYPDAPHGFSMSDTASYQEAGAERMFATIEALFARTLGGSVDA